jgi:hypothetical protein
MIFAWLWFGLAAAEMGHHIDRLGEEGPHPGEGRSVSQRCCQMGFAQAVTPALRISPKIVVPWPPGSWPWGSKRG